MISIKNNGVTLYDVYEYTFSESVMGESTISLPLFVPPTIVENFSTEYYVEYNNKRYYLKTKLPTGQKSTDSLMYEYTLLFVDAGYQLRRTIVRDLATIAPDTYISKGVAFQIYATFETYTQLLLNNIKYSIGDNWSITITLNTPPTNSVTIDVNNLYIWELLLKSYEYYGVTWRIDSLITDGIESNVIVFSDTATTISHVFKYQNGLSKIVRAPESEDSYNRISGAGGTKNIPVNYFSNRNTKYPSDPNPIDSGVIIRNLMPSVFRDSVIAGTPPYIDYVEDAVLVANDGVKEASIPINEDIYPSIANVNHNTLGLLDEIVYAERPAIDTVRPQTETYTPVIVHADRGSLPNDVHVTSTGNLFDVTNGTAFAKYTISYIDEYNNTIIPTSSGLNVLNEDSMTYVTITGDMVDIAALYELYNESNVQQDYWYVNSIESSNGTLETTNLANGKYYFKVTLSVSGNVTRNAYEAVQFGADTSIYNIQKKNTQRDQLFDIWIKDIGIDIAEGFNLADDKYTTTEEAKIVFNSGMLAGREFVIHAPGGVRAVEQDTSQNISGVPSKWRITLIKSDSDVDNGGFLMPNTRVYAQAGDRFIITGINMPQAYIELAEQRLTDYLTTQLNAVKHEKQTYSVEIDPISLEEPQLLRSGNKITIQDDKLAPTEVSLYINGVTIDYKDNILPDYTLTLSNTLSVNGNQVERLQSQVEVISNTLLFGSVHQHTNKSLLDGVTSNLIELWNSAVTDKHTHTNKTTLDKLTDGVFASLTNISGWGNHATAGYAMATDLAAKLNISTFNDMFVKEVIDGVSFIKANYNFYSTGGVSAYGIGVVGSGGGGDGTMVTWGTEANGSVQLIVESVSKSLSLASHAHTNYLTAETDPTVPDWAKAATKPSYVASEIGGLGASYRWLTDTYISTWNAKEPAIVKLTAFNKNFGTTAGTVSEGNHTHNYLSAETDPTVPSHVKGITTTNISNWNSAAGNTHTHLNKSLLDDFSQSDNDVLNHFSVVDGKIKVDVDFYSTGGVSAYGYGASGSGGGSMVVWGTESAGAVPLTVEGVTKTLSLASHTHNGYLTSESDPTVPAWAKASTKPSYTASEIGGLGASYRWLTDTYISTWNAKEPAIVKGTTAQYFRGDMSLAAFPTSLPASDVYTWAKAATKPAYVASEIGGLGASYRWLTDTYISTWNAKEPAITKLTAFNKNFGTTAGTVSEGNHTHTFASLTSKPTTLAGYGITDALLASAYTAADVLTKLKTVDGHTSGLDADTVDGKHLTTSGWWDKLAYIGADGVMEVGAHIDFHGTNTGTEDYSARLSSSSGSPLWNGNAMYYALNANRTDVNWATSTLTAQTDILTPFNTWTHATDKNSLKKFLNLFDIDTAGNLVVKTNLYSTGEVTAYKSGTGVSGLTLQGDMNANGKAISNPGSILYNNFSIGYDADEVYSPTAVGLWDANNSAVAVFNPGSNQCFYGFGNVGMDNTGMELYNGVMTAPAFNFGSWSFKEVGGNMVISYNGTAKATIQSSRINTNL